MKVLMVDVDGVVVRGRPADGLPPLTYLERDLGLPTALLQREFFALHWSEIVTGKEALMPRLESVLARIAPQLSAETLRSYWFENDSRLDHVLLEALAARRARGVSIFLATNQEHMRAKYLMEERGLAAHVDGILYSAALGCRKPSQEFYRLANEHAGVAAEDIVFIDDIRENVEAARAFGWNAVEWDGEIGLDEALAPFADGR